MPTDKRHRILVVDDERDVCETIADELADYDVDLAYSFDEADAKLKANRYDAVVLDIMGVRGHELLDLYGREVACIMLTAHAFTVDAFERSVHGHARLFLPKHEMARLSECIAQVIKSPHPLWDWLVRTFDVPRTFGPEFMATNLLRRIRAAEGEEQPKQKKED